MNWYKQAQNILILWHATIPKFAEEIIESGFIKPSSQLDGYDYAGWNLEVPGKEYGNLVFLETDKNEAIGYADIRLDRLMLNMDLEELLENEEDCKFVAVFKVIITNPGNNKLTDIDIKSVDINHKEYVYEGVIPKQPNPEIYFEGPEWIERDALWQKHIKQSKQLQEEFWRGIADKMTEQPTQSYSTNWYKQAQELGLTDYRDIKGKGRFYTDTGHDINYGEENRLKGNEPNENYSADNPNILWIYSNGQIETRPETQNANWHRSPDNWGLGSYLDKLYTGRYSPSDKIISILPPHEGMNKFRDIPSFIQRALRQKFPMAERIIRYN